MDERSLDIFSLNAERIRLSGELCDCLRREKLALVELRTEAILQTNPEKEILGVQLATTRGDILRWGRERFGDLPEGEWPLGDAWRTARESWLGSWEETRRQCEDNQRFLKHSLKNLGLIVGNLKRLFGETATYSSTGKKLDQRIEGKVVEARY